MLFNSHVFLYCFLPLVLVGYQLAGKLHRRGVVVWLGLASLFFYGYYKPAFLLVLGTSIFFNYCVSMLISRAIANNVNTRLLLSFAIAGNLGALCWFKYLFPFVNSFSRLLHGQHWQNMVLPLGISFFTITQIAYLVDLQQGAAKQQDFFTYLLFVSFFPHVIAGPILHHKDIMPQFQQDKIYQLRLADVGIGLTWFIMGLGKKVILADTFSKTAETVFAAQGRVNAGEAWFGVLCYSLQLYFDFSGYCDMANGLARMLSIDFPLNFSSPYKASNILDFWQRWHMTLTQYIGDYLYSPMQFAITRWRQRRGKGITRKAQKTPGGYLQMICLPTIVTMAIAGIWHGAGLQFLIFGLLHGVYLAVAHGWKLFRSKSKQANMGGRVSEVVGHVGGVSLTYACVLLAQVFFRAPSTREAFLLLKRMFGLSHAPANVHLSIDGFDILYLALGYFIVWALPNTQQLLIRFNPALRPAASDREERFIPLFWKPSLAWGIAIGLVLLEAIVRLDSPSTFLYFQF